jgi:aryl-alcohol dehydrogenase-like predicted oxidoreductase
VQYGSIAGVGNRVSRLVIGSMVFGTAPDTFANTCHLLDAFAAAGGTTIDTARVYARGTSEAAVGEWLRRSGTRDQMVIIGKGAHHDSQTFERRVTPAAIHEDVETTLRAMQLDVIDIYILHKDDPDAAVGPVVEALNAEVQAGRIKVFGGSSWTHQRIQAANDYAAERGLQGFTVSSPNLALAVPNEPMWAGCVSVAGDPEAQAWYAETKMPLFAWSSQARGFFSGRYSPQKTVGDTTDEQNVIRTYYSDANWERYRRADELAKEKGCTRQQVVLAWVLHQPLDIYALVGPATVGELADSLGALNVSLAPDELAWLNLEGERSRQAGAGTRETARRASPARR